MLLCVSTSSRGAVTIYVYFFFFTVAGHKPCSIQQCSVSNDADVSPLKNVNLSSLKRGTGGRSSFNGICATVFGSSGFLGRYVCNRLGKIGTQVIFYYRSYQTHRTFSMKFIPNIGINIHNISFFVLFI